MSAGRIEGLVERLAEVKAEATVCSSPEEAQVALAKLCEGRTVARWEDAVLAAAPGQEVPPEEAQLSLVVADVAVAGTGSIGLVHGPGRSRRTALLPPAQVIWLRAGDVVATVDDALVALYGGRAPAEVPASFVFVTGPSRTRDIGLIPLLGVHSPAHLHVVIVTG